MAERAGARSQVAQLVFAGVVLLVLLILTGPLQYLPRCVLAGIVFTIAAGMIDVTGLRDIRRESSGEFYLAVVTAAAVVAIGVEQGILLAIALSLFRHVRHSYRPHTMMLASDATGRWIPVPATPGKETEPGLIVYRFDADSFYANQYHFADQVRALVERAPRGRYGLRACQSVPAFRHGPARHHGGDPGDAGFRDPPRSHRCGARWRFRARCGAIRGTGLPRRSAAQ